MKLKRKTIVIFAILAITIIIIFPITINFLLFDWRSLHTNGDMDTWLIFFATYYGAVVGGLISGSITLGGVYLTIQNERKLRIADSFPIKRKNAGQVLSGLEKFMESFKVYFDSKNIKNSEGLYIEKTDREEFKDGVNNIKYILDLSANVNGRFFGSIRKIIFNLDEINLLTNIKPIHPYHELEKQMQCGDLALEIIDLVDKAKSEAQKIDNLLDSTTE